MRQNNAVITYYFEVVKYLRFYRLALEVKDAQLKLSNSVPFCLWFSYLNHNGFKSGIKCISG